MPENQRLLIAVAAAAIIVVVILAIILAAVLCRNTLSVAPGQPVDTAGEQIMHLMQNLVSAATWPSEVIPPRVMPVKFTISQSGAVTCSVKLLRFYPSDIKIIWTNEDKVIPSTKKLIQTDEEQTFDATSECTVPWKYFIFGVRVTWEHQSLPSPQHRDLYVEDLPWRLHVGSISFPKLEDGINANLTCEISGYFPHCLSVSWFIKKDGDVTARPIEPSETERTYRISHKKVEQKDHTYNYEASLFFTPLINADQGSEIICRVEHPSLESPLETSTGPLDIDECPIERSTGPLDICDCPIERSTGLLHIDECPTERRAGPLDICERPIERSTGLLHIDECPTERRAGPLDICERPIERSTGLLHIGTLTDLEIGEINVPELILGKMATLTCRLYNYISGVHTVEWFEEGSERGEQRAEYDPRWLRTIERDEQSEDERIYIANLTLTPVTRADNGITYICRVKTSNTQKTIEKRTERLHVKETAEQRTTEERRTVGSGRPLPVNEPIHEKKQKTSAEIETDLLGERDNQDCTPAPKNGKSKGLCPAKEQSGEEGTEECPSPTNKPCDEEETDQLEESSTRENEELKKEKKENKETSQVINNPFNEEETDESKEPSTGEDEEENNEKEEENEETSQVINNPLNEKQSEQEETSEEVRREISGGLCLAGESPQEDHEETSMLSNEEKHRAGLRERSPHEMETKSSDGLCAANQLSEEEDDDETKPLNNTIWD